MEVNEYPNLQKALENNLIRNLSRPIVWHYLYAGERVGAHKEKVAEWIFINQGEFTIIVGNSRIERAHLTYNLKGKKWLVFWIPAGQRHALEAKSDLSYFVLKGV